MLDVSRIHCIYLAVRRSDQSEGSVPLRHRRKMIVQVVEVESLAVDGAVHRWVVGVGYGLSG